MDARHKGEHDAIKLREIVYPIPLPFSATPISASTATSSTVAGTA